MIQDPITSGSCSVHKKRILLQPHLWLVGCGGSVPVRLEDHSIHSNGYPHKTEDMNEGIRENLQNIPEDDSVIVLTHNPPSTVGKE